MKPEKMEALVQLLKKRGASKKPLTEAGLTDTDCKALGERLAASLPKKAPVALKKAAAKGRAQIFCDGASRGNPGPASLGFTIILDEVEIAAEGRALGTLTNNQAEYLSLKAALESAGQLGLAKIDIAMDSELVVRQVLGRYKVKNEKLKPLFADVMTLLRGFGDWNIRHIPRGENSRADALANQALDSL